ncbi:MAG: peptidase M14 [Kofleriaceae bacterium]|nr:peptidase M14 [Kofleriaceae bacterium]MCL4228305.1 peptidase M14 [Myxococcales bacterium]
MPRLVVPDAARHLTTASLVVSLVVLALACGARTTPTPPAELDLITTAERTGWERTGRHDEAVRLCRELATAYPRQARCDTYGHSPEGRALVALVVSADGALTPAEVARHRRPVVLVQAGIHAGEIEGKDAGLALLRDALAGEAVPGALAAVTVVFVPIVNVDGHERFGPNHRVNQRGPAEMGFRTTARNLNLNRDYVKVDAPEMAALLDLFNRWQPAVYVDLHATDGARFEHDIAVLVAPLGARPDGLERAAAALSRALQRRLAARGHLPLDFYPSFVEADDPASGFATGDAPARFSQAYAAARDRLGVLVEAHSWRTYGERALATRHVLEALLEEARGEAGGWQRAVDDARRAAAALAGEEVVLLTEAGAEGRVIDFRGYAYERRRSEVSGGTWIVYDETRPEVWRVPLRDRLVPRLTVRAPRGGYLVPAAWAEVVAPRLRHHGVTFVRTRAPLAVADGEVFRAEAVSFAPPFEGRARATVRGAWQAEAVTVGAGALWVPMAQAGARLALHLLEPTAPDSLAAWGFFNAVFEQKEYMEDYVAEEVARAMLAAEPGLAAEFEAWLAADPARAQVPRARLDFFYRRHPSWDAHKDRLPVVRTDTVPAALAAD